MYGYVLAAAKLNIRHEIWNLQTVRVTVVCSPFTHSVPGPWIAHQVFGNCPAATLPHSGRGTMTVQELRFFLLCIRAWLCKLALHVLPKDVQRKLLAERQTRRRGELHMASPGGYRSGFQQLRKLPFKCDEMLAGHYSIHAGYA